MFCWTDLWHSLTMADIRAIEDKTKHELDEVYLTPFYTFVKKILI